MLISFNNDDKIIIEENIGQKPIIEYTPKRKLPIFIFKLDTTRVHWLLRWAVEQTCKLLLITPDINQLFDTPILVSHGMASTGAAIFTKYTIVTLLLQLIGYSCSAQDIQHLMEE